LSAELNGARRNAEYVKRIAAPHSADEVLANGLLLIVQYLEKLQKALIDGGADNLFTQ
jgi:hypothetical protein